MNNCASDSTVAITVAESLAGKSENITGSPYVLDAGKNLTLNGPTTGDFTVTSATASQVLLYVNESASADIRDINFAGHDAQTRTVVLLDVGGATLNLTRVDFDDFASSSNHSLLNLTSSAHVTIANSNIRNNRAPSGAIGASGSSVAGDTSLTISNSTFSGNQSTNQGGALYTFDTDLSIEDSIFDGNQSTTDTANSGGGAIYNAGEYSHATTTIRNSTFRNNQARNYGGAIFQSSLASFTVEDSVFENNTVTAASNEFGQGVNAEAHGGALALDRSGAISITRTRFSDNSATSRGGAVYIGRSGREGTVTIADSTFSNNSAVFSASESTLPSGGAISTDALNTDPYSLVIRRSTFSGNAATGSVNASAGAVYASGAGVGLTIENSTFDGNSSAGIGGALSLLDLPGANLSHITATDNESSGTINAAAGFLYASTPSATIAISHSVFYGNTSGNANGGSICVSSEFSFDAVLDYSYWDGINNTAGGCRAPVAEASVITSSADPKLGALADNGGDTLTRYPAADSPLINAGNSSIDNAPETDQRGSSRISRGVIDIGAVEYGNLPPVVESTPDAQTLALGEEINLDASAWFTDPEGDSLSFSATGLPQGITLDAESGAITGSTDVAGSYSITVTAEDAYGLSESVTFDVTVPAKKGHSKSGGTLPLWMLLLGAAGLLRRRR